MFRKKANALFYLIIFLCSNFNLILAVRGADVYTGSCSTAPTLPLGFKRLLFMGTQHGGEAGAVFSCDRKQLAYPKSPSPSDSISGKMFFVSYGCRNNKWVNKDRYYNNRYLECVRGCKNTAESDSLKVVSKPKSCVVLNDKDDTESPPSYISCEISCKSGYYTDSKGQNQVSNQIVYCIEQPLMPNAESFWNISDGTDLEPFVKCFEGCFAYGSYHEETYGMIVNFKPIGNVDGVSRYESGEIWCDNENGYFAVSNNLKENIIMQCEQGDHWEPTMPEFYCEKGCRKPGGKFGGAPILGYRFACSSGVNGWYLNCAFSCDGDAGYTMDGRRGILPNGPRSESIRCKNGVFDLSKTEKLCRMECSPSKLCPKGMACTGYIRNHKREDTGRRYCKKDTSTSRSMRLKRSFQSVVSATMVRTFGGYDWLI